RTRAELLADLLFALARDLDEVLKRQALLAQRAVKLGQQIVEVVVEQLLRVADGRLGNEPLQRLFERLLIRDVARRLLKLLADDRPQLVDRLLLAAADLDRQLVAPFGQHARAHLFDEDRKSTRLNSSHVK